MQTQLEREILEQPASLERTISGARPQARALARDIASRGVSYVYIAARGTSDHAGLYASYLFPAFNGLPVALATPSLFTFYHQPPKLHGGLVLGISQSGQSEDIVEVLAEAGRQGALTAAITNAPESPLASQAAHVLPLSTGPETAVAATKTYTATLAALALLSAELSSDQARQADLQRLPAWAQETLDRSAGPARAKAERYRYMDRLVIIGRGFNYATAFEIALKLKELTYVTALPASSADFRHGPVAIIEPGYPVMLVAPRGTMMAEVLEFGRQLAGRGAEILSIGNTAEVLDIAATPLPIAAEVPEWLSPVAAVMPGQLLGLHLALAKGLSADAPRGLSKVTVTR